MAIEYGTNEHGGAIEPSLLQDPNYLVFSQFQESLKRSGAKLKNNWVGVVDGMVVATDPDRAVVDKIIDETFPGKDSFVGQIKSERKVRINLFKRIFKV
jgi:hypothetical protein